MCRGHQELEEMRNGLLQEPPGGPQPWPPLDLSPWTLIWGFWPPELSGSMSPVLRTPVGGNLSHTAASGK